MAHRMLLGFAAIAALACTAVLAQETPPPPALSLDLAYQAASATLESCKAKGFLKASVAIADVEGVLLVMLRSPGAPSPTVESARRKAYTAAKTGMSTAEFAKSKGWVDPGPPPAAAMGGAQQNPFSNLPVFDNDPNLVPWSGGLTIKAGGKVVGGIGLSGASGGQKDEDCVTDGLAKIKAKLK